MQQAAWNVTGINKKCSALFLLGLLEGTLLMLAKQQTQIKAEKQIGKILPQGVFVLELFIHEKQIFCS